MDKTKIEVDARSCLACNFSGSASGLARSSSLVCRKNPPTVSAALLQGPDGLIWNSASSFPAVTATDWCSLFQPKLN